MMKTTVVHGKKLFMTWLRYAGSMCRRHGSKSFHATGARILSDDLTGMEKISVAERFGITKKEAEDIACDIRKTVADRWRDLAQKKKPRTLHVILEKRWLIVGGTLQNPAVCPEGK